MKIERIQEGSSSSIDTSESKYFKKAWKEANKQIKGLDGYVIDPFARNCKWADITNDLNPNTKAKYHLDAKDFLMMILEKYGANSVKCLIFDPPFSNSQYKKYEKTSQKELINIYSTSGKVKEIFEIAQKLISPGGIIIKLGYNTTKPIFDYEMTYLSITNFGGNRNDVLTTIWKNPNQTLF
jgi:hypothetical protein